MVKRCDFPNCYEKAPFGFSAYGDLPDKDDTVELFDFDLCRKHYGDLNAKILRAVAQARKGAKP
jgi:hypothetical protein